MTSLCQAELTGELVEEGKELVKREKRRRERLAESSRNRCWLAILTVRQWHQEGVEGARD